MMSIAWTTRIQEYRMTSSKNLLSARGRSNRSGFLQLCDKGYVSPIEAHRWLDHLCRVYCAKVNEYYEHRETGRGMCPKSGYEAWLETFWRGCMSTLTKLPVHLARSLTQWSSIKFWCSITEPHNDFISIGKARNMYTWLRLNQLASLFFSTSFGTSSWLHHKGIY